MLLKPQQAKKATDESKAKLEHLHEDTHVAGELTDPVSLRMNLESLPFRSAGLKLLGSGFLFLAGCCLFQWQKQHRFYTHSYMKTAQGLLHPAP